MPVLKTETSPKDNLVLAALPDAELAKLVAELEHVAVADGDVLWEAGEKGDHLYFPTTAMISLVYEHQSGNSISVATLGRDGIAGMYIIAGIRMPDRAIVQCGGEAYRMRSSKVKNELAECGDFHALLLSYTNSLLVQISQNSICNRLHRIDQQLSRWLLECRDKLRTDSLSLTHDQIAGVLGVRRESVSLAAARLQKENLIKIGRGKIEIVNAGRLEKASCECYAVIKNHFEAALKEYVKSRGE